MNITSGQCGRNLTWILNGSTLTISGKGPMEDFLHYVGECDWPIYHDSYLISPWLRDGERETRITKVIINKGVTRIGRNAFGCTITWRDHSGNTVYRSNQHLYLTSIVIPDSVTEIDRYAFSGCTALEEIVLPSSIEKIGFSAFEGCVKLRKITLPSKLQEIDNCAFSGCTALQSIIIPPSTQRIGGCAFSGCTQLDNVVIPDSVDTIQTDAFQGTPFLAKLSHKNDFIVLGACAHKYTGAAKAVQIPDGVRTIASNLFANNQQLRDIVIPESVKVIEESAFENCSELQSVTIPRSVKEIESRAFKNCKKLSTVNICYDSTRFYRTTFIGTPWWENRHGSIIADGVLIDYRGNDIDYTIPSNVTIVGDESFASTSLRTLVIPHTVRRLGKLVCDHKSKMTELHLPESLHMFTPKISSIYACPAVKQVYYGESKQFSVNGIHRMGCAGDNVVWLQQYDDTILFFGNGTVDFNLLIDTFDYDLGESQHYNYIWGSEWSGKIVVCDGITLPEPFPKVIPSASMKQPLGICEHCYFFTVVREDGSPMPE